VLDHSFNQSKMKMKKKKQTYVVCLRNNRDEADSETRRVQATSPEDARDKVNYDESRFSIGQILTLKEYKK
jgi:hypothetical protein